MLPGVGKGIGTFTLHMAATRTNAGSTVTTPVQSMTIDTFTVAFETLFLSPTTGGADRAVRFDRLDGQRAESRSGQPTPAATARFSGQLTGRNEFRRVDYLFSFTNLVKVQ